MFIAWTYSCKKRKKLTKIGKKRYLMGTYILSGILFSKYCFHPLVYIFLKKTSRGILEGTFVIFLEKPLILKEK